MSSKKSFSFIPLEIPEENGNLVKTLEKLMPTTAQILNVIKIKEQKLYSEENIRHFKFLSYEVQVDDSKKKVRDWSDESLPLFIIGLYKIKHAMEQVKEGFTFRTLYSRETPSPEDFQLLEAFIPVFDWSSLTSPVIFGTADARYGPFLEKVCKRQGRHFTMHPISVMYLEKEEATRFQDDIKTSSILNNKDANITPLLPSQAEIVNSHWKFKSEGSLQHIQDQIENSISAGLTTKGELSCWIISMPGGTLNALHTKDAYRKKGYAELVMKFVCFQTASRGLYPLTEIEPESSASMNLMEKLVFKHAFKGGWVFCTKNNTR